MPPLDYEQQLCSHCNENHYIVNPGAEALIFAVLQEKQTKLGEDNEVILAVEVLQSHTQSLKCQIAIAKKEHQASRDDMQIRANERVALIKRREAEIDSETKQFEAEREAWRVARLGIIEALKPVRKYAVPQ
ncbi:hypothetical protein BU16DRAFT_560773 [Lophium mytilinum]|uniref:Uncharacterized protein n=1 Tax=Lophium mytilinum TaxID=390894 RepID=A0A6A6QUP1_9PEZI|nr:hypothetical protein BU16DRAFT_560773 [Lophium mytilinum]